MISVQYVFNVKCKWWPLIQPMHWTCKKVLFWHILGRATLTLKEGLKSINMNNCRRGKKCWFSLVTRPRRKVRGRVLNPARFVFIFIFSWCRKTALLRCWLLASRQSWDTDWVACADSDHVLLRVCSFQLEKHEIMVLACQVGPFHLRLTQIN